MFENRIVALLTPVFAGLSGMLAQELAGIVPGEPLNETELVAVFIAGALAATVAAVQWLRGWSKHEENETLLELHSEPEDEEEVVV